MRETCLRFLHVSSRSLVACDYSEGCGVGVGVRQSPGFGPPSELESLIERRLRLLSLSVSSGLLYNFVRVYLTFVQFILQLKLCLYTVHLLL